MDTSKGSSIDKKKDTPKGANQNISLRLYHKGRENVTHTRNYKSRRG